ncbi:recombinase family protein [Kitasatospora sp. NPDC059646]|uniref:recombinase family protein n=1 Tax=Kitasatospora sp. NPDC059646 TaxID=3346893 RepID=UPI0036ADD149
MEADNAVTDPAKLMDILARKSVKLDGRRGELSTDAQEARGRQWADWNGLTVRKVWTEKISASKGLKRPDYDRALAALAAGEIGTLWCYKLDRFSRMGALAVLTALEAINGGRIIFGEDGLDSANPDHRRMIMWRAEDAREESERISTRVTDTKAFQRDSGEWVSGRIPYGLVANKDRKLVADESPAHPDDPSKGSKASVVQRIFRDAASGEYSLRKIAADLYDDGIPSVTGGRWSQNTIYRMLHNPAYSGWQVRKLGNGPGIIHTDAKGRRVQVGAVLITDALRSAATRAIAGHAKPAKVETRGRARHLLTGLAKCANCGRSMPRESRSYACGARLSGGKPCDRQACAFAPAVEAYVLQAWLDRLTNSEPDDLLLAIVAERWAALTKPVETAEAEEARAVLAAAEAVMERMLRDRRAGLYEGAAARFFEPAWRDAVQDVDNAREALRAHAGPSINIGFLMDEESAREAWEAADLPLRRDLLRLAIDRVEISKATHRGAFNGHERVTIRWASVS